MEYTFGFTPNTEVPTPASTESPTPALSNVMWKDIKFNESIILI